MLPTRCMHDRENRRGLRVDGKLFHCDPISETTPVCVDDAAFPVAILKEVHVEKRVDHNH